MYQTSSSRKFFVTGFTVIALVLGSMVAASAMDIGEMVEQLLKAQSQKFFGFNNPLDQSATNADVVARDETNSPADRQFLANGLTPSFVARNVATSADMIAFWPTDTDYTHLIICIEQGRNGTTPGGNGGLNASVQRVDLSTGDVETILHGMNRCDGIRTTQWGTILATEERDDGGAYEIIDPLGTTGHWVADRATGDIRDAIDSITPSTTVVKRAALVTQAWEGLEVLDNGVVIGGDELRPEFDNDGGSIFRFVPSVPFDCDGAPVRPGQLCGNPISDLSESPLASGSNYALATVCNGTSDFGQGCEAGNGVWIEVGNVTARDDANVRGATGYCRPEDLGVDRSFGEFAGGEGIRWCWTNTCGGGLGEVMCAEESDMDASDVVFDENFGFNLLAQGGGPAEVLVTRFVQGDEEFNSEDNIDIQPFTNNVYVVEDHSFGDIWACIQDGADRDFVTDGCVRMLSIRDPEAEPTGFIFDGTGEVAFYNIQHGQQDNELLDFNSNPVNGHTDDMMMITGFKVKNKKK